MFKFVKKFIVLFLLTPLLPLSCLLFYHKLNTQKDGSKESVKMLNGVSDHFMRQINNNGEAAFKNAIIIAPVMIEVYDGVEKIAALNSPPFPFEQKNYIWKDYDGLRFKFIEIPDNTRQMKQPPITIPQFVILLSSLIMSIFLISYISKVFIRPLNEIINGLKKVKDGDLTVKFDTNSENSYMKKTFETLNEMLKGLIEKEILRNNFLQNLVHDLRAPIVAQNRAIEILEDELNHELITGMKDNNEDYLKLINLILESQKLEAFDVEIDKIDLNFTDLVESVFCALTPLAEEKNIALEYKVQPDDLKIWADYISMSRILINMVSNAVENIEDNKKITILAKNIDNFSEITVSDNGCGIKQENLEVIFDKYKSLGSSSSKSVSGIGLSSVKNLVEKHGGKISVESCTDEGGSFTKFRITLPLRG